MFRFYAFFTMFILQLFQLGCVQSMYINFLCSPTHTYTMISMTYQHRSKRGKNMRDNGTAFEDHN